ncbi:Abi family protein [Bacillus velezensis]|uniref:Abi family protein n=1 Tax=Bacillus velezensis TaxID=492670 RepID=UPI00102E7784|nr:Abi family protein [Bacillus velezensis]TAI30770.1 Abi family protein [Bacillus velezensis]
MKPFKTFRQQLTILRDRGLVIKSGSKAMRVLENENYYSLINGYKDLFLKKDTNNKPVSPEKYKNGATFEDIYNLYTIDRDLRNLILEYLLKFESSIKSKISYLFSEEYKDSHAYLVWTNYTKDPKKSKTVLDLISTITSTISKKGNKKNSPIKHYLDTHDSVPLWVLVNYLSMGNMEYFYLCLRKNIQNKVAKDFSAQYSRDYKVSLQFPPEMIENILKTATFFRNVCAHEDRLYNFRLYKPAKNSLASSLLNIPQKELDKGNLFTLISFLKLVLPKKEHKILISNLKKTFIKYSSSFTSVNFEDILKEMGFELHWESYFN